MPLVVMVALVALAAVIHDRFYTSYFPAGIGVIYIVTGLFIGREYILIGAWLVLCGVTGLAMPVVISVVWMAFAGGGGLLLTGFILRRQLQKLNRLTEP